MNIYCKVDGEMCKWHYIGDDCHKSGIGMVAASLEQAFEVIPQDQRPKMGAILALIEGGRK